MKGLYLYVPEGTGIGWSPFGLMRNDAVWGADAKMFRPERWLEGSEEMRKKRDLDLDMVFGSGNISVWAGTLR